MGIFFRLKQYVKSYIQNRYLPKIYDRWVSRLEVKPDRIIFCDLHSDTLPYSMRFVCKALKKNGKDVKIYCRDIKNMSLIESFLFMKGFMKEYAAAGYVYICSYFLPVSSCNKRPETKVVQLWHSGGLLKKMGRDTKDDIPEYYKGNVTANYDLVTVSAPICVPVWESALGLPQGITKPLGLPRTDIYYNDKWNTKCRERFYEFYPEAMGKKIALYAPSFSGNAATPKCEGLSRKIETVFKDLEDWFLVIRPHPHLRTSFPEYFDERFDKISTEKLLPVADLMITDYSSILFDYSIYRKPFILYCPDIEEYVASRGFYVDPYSFPCELVKTKEELHDAIVNLKVDTKALEEFYQKYMSGCDGKATKRVIRESGLVV